MFVDKPMVITEPAVASARLSGLGLKLYPSNLPRMFNKDLTPFMLTCRVFLVYAKMEHAKETLLLG